MKHSIIVFTAILFLAVPFSFSQSDSKEEAIKKIQEESVLAGQSVSSDQNLNYQAAAKFIPGQNAGVTLVNDYLVAYDSTSANGRISMDSVVANLTAMGASYDLFNRGGQISTNIMSFLGYKTIIWLGEATSVMSVVQKDSVKAYLNSGTPGTKSKLIIFSEDVGYQFGRAASTYYDLDFVNNYLGWDFVADRPGTAAHGLLGVFINVGQTDSTVGTWPDVLSVNNPAFGEVLYRFRSFPDSANAIGYRQPNFEVATFGVDIRSLRPAIDSPPGSPVTRLLTGAMGFVPVELTSFTAAVSKNAVTLNWSTATETNNQGFEVERKSSAVFVKIGYVPGYGTTADPKTYSFSEKYVKEGVHTYRLKQIDFDGTVTYSQEIEVEISVPKEFNLSQNFPNPFNPTTKINFSLAVDSKVTLKIFNILGQEVLTLLNQNLAASNHEISFNASGLNSGVYFYQIEAQGIDGRTFSDLKKMVLLK
jgi:hypothetical protein